MRTVSFSEIDARRQCPFKHQLAYNERWIAPASGTNALAKGSAYHLIMETHFRALKTVQYGPWSDEDRKLAAVQAVQTRIDEMRDTNEYPEETIALVEWMYVGYIDQYDIDKDWHIIAVESTHVVPFFYPDAEGVWHEDTEHNLKVKLDLLVSDNRDRLWIVDHKSGGQIPHGEKDFAFADQFGLYHYAMRYLDYKVCGTIHNAVTTKQNKGDIFSEGDPEWKSTMKAQPLDSRMKRTFMDRTEIELQMIQWDALKTVRKMTADEDPERNPDEERCQWKCSYNDACLFGRRNGDTKTRVFLMDTGFTQEFARH